MTNRSITEIKSGTDICAGPTDHPSIIGVGLPAAKRYARLTGKHGDIKIVRTMSFASGYRVLQAEFEDGHIEVLRETSTGRLISKDQAHKIWMAHQKEKQ